jgi:enoyl-CoA hydratase/carnithine racemase
MTGSGTTPAPATLRVEEADDRVVVTLHRPQARNAINAAMYVKFMANAELEA